MSSATANVPASDVAAFNADARKINAFLDATARRIRLLALLRAATIGAAIAAVAGIVRAIVILSTGSDRGMSSTVLLVAALLCTAVLLLVVWLRTRGARDGAAIEVERRSAQSSQAPSHNLIVTADELSRGQHHAAVSGDMRAIVMRQAAARIAPIDLAALFPTMRGAQFALAGAALFALTLQLPSTTNSAGGLMRGVRALSRSAIGARTAIDRVQITITAPRYTGRAPERTVDPTRVEALAGSRLRITVDGTASRFTIATADSTVSESALPDSAVLRTNERSGTASPSTYSVDVPVTTDGFIVIQALDSAGRRAARRMIGISAIPDAAPRVRIVRPARDLVLQDSLQSIPLAIEADDDLALATLRLRYTRVSGSGERFTFDEGEVPIRITRSSARAWTASVQWNLSSLALGVGDMLVYRAVASDGRPGSAVTESDAFIAQRLSKDGDAAPGFAVDPDEERQALSQQMLILKTERLLAKARTLAPPAFADEAAGIAVEQRRVRAEFVFMMGGELSEAISAENSMGDLDESHEAESESDLSDGRLANQWRAALLGAIRSMSRAATLLNAGDVTAALPEERAAVELLQRAFSRSRYLLRALSQREALDLTRRGTGDLSEAARTRRDVEPPDRDAYVLALRAAMSALIDARASLTGLGAGDARAASTVATASSATATTVTPASIAERLANAAERLLRTAPSGRETQAAADDVNNAARAVGSASSTSSVSAPTPADRSTVALIDRASVRVAALLRAGAGAAARAPRSAAARRLSAGAPAPTRMP